MSLPLYPHVSESNYLRNPSFVSESLPFTEEVFWVVFRLPSTSSSGWIRGGRKSFLTVVLDPSPHRDLLTGPFPREGPPRPGRRAPLEDALGSLPRTDSSTRTRSRERRRINGRPKSVNDRSDSASKEGSSTPAITEGTSRQHF